MNELPPASTALFLSPVVVPAGSGCGSAAAGAAASCALVDGVITPTVNKAAATTNGSQSFRRLGSFIRTIAKVSHARRMKFARHSRRTNHDGHDLSLVPPR